MYILELLCKIRMNCAEIIDLFYMMCREGRICKVAVTAYFNVLSQHLIERTEENHENPLSKWLVHWPIIVSGTCRVLVTLS
jgi:hypothetical protein